MKDKINYSKEEQNSKPKKTRSSKQKANIWLGVGATIITIGGVIVKKLLTGEKGNDGGKPA